MDKKQTLNERDRAWLCGLLSMSGTIYESEGVVNLVVKSATHQAAVNTFGQLTGAQVKGCQVNRKPAVRVTIRGERLRVLLKELWDELSVERKREYRDAMLKARETV